MSASTQESWDTANQRALMTAVGVVRARLEHYAGGREGAVEIDRDGSYDHCFPPSALDRLCAVFGLSYFEREVLLLCAGVEFETRFSTLCAAAQGDPARAYPTFSLALAMLDDPHWSAITPSAPLRRWRLIEVGEGTSLTHSPLRIDERVLHYLAGVPHPDERLAGIVENRQHDDDALAPSQQRVASAVAALLGSGEDATRQFAVQLCGNQSAPKLAVAVTACRALKVDLKIAGANALPVDPRELDGLIHLLDREAALANSALFLDCDQVDSADAARSDAIRRVIDRMQSILFVASPDRRRGDHRALIAFDVGRPTADEQADAWRDALGDRPDRDAVANAISAQFSLDGPEIRTICTQALAKPDQPADVGAQLWDAARALARPRMSTLAQRITPRATWDDLILPDAQLHQLHDVAVHVRQRSQVYRRWGFADRYSRGLGISLLAAGPSGAGKTMAAEVLANELRLDLYQIDLSQVVSKYIGETEKNLGRLFDAAEGGGAILLFDEADALFGKRSEVKDSHDRYANIEVSYLLQRIEAFSGLAILTTNMKEALDTAFLRRIRFVVQFPFPDAELRTAIWRRVFPTATPTANLDVERLARLSLSGGSIRNVALNAAFLAAESGQPVGMIHLAGAVRGEFAKLEKPLSETEVGAWT